MLTVLVDEDVRRDVAGEGVSEQSELAGLRVCGDQTSEKGEREERRAVDAEGCHSVYCLFVCWHLWV